MTTPVVHPFTPGPDADYCAACERPRASMYHDDGAAPAETANVAHRDRTDWALVVMYAAIFLGSVVFAFMAGQDYERSHPADDRFDAGRRYERDRYVYECPPCPGETE